MISKIHFRHSYRRCSLIAFLAAVCLLTGCGKKSVATAANEFEANLMFDILHSNGFRVEKTSPEGDIKIWDIIVDEGWFGEGEAATAIQVLRDYGLPRPPEPEIKTNDSLGIVSDREEKERQRRELQIQLERQLYTLPDVIRASVIIAQPVDDVLSLEKTPPTASVSLVLKETQPKFTIEAVQNLVSGGVPNLKTENVKVAISQQSLREIPLEKLAAQRRSNAIFAVGIGVVILLAAILGGVWTFAKRRKESLPPAKPDELLENDESDEDYEQIERPQLSAEPEK